MDAPLLQSNGEAAERRKWNAFWHEIPGWVKASVMALAGLTVGAGGVSRILGHQDEEGMSKRLLVLETKFDKMQEDLKDLKEDNKEILRSLRFRPGR